MRESRKKNSSLSQSVHQGQTSIAKVLVVCNCSDTGAIWSLCIRQKKLNVVLETSVENASKRCVREVPDMLVLDVAGSTSAILNLIKTLRIETIAPLLLLTPESGEPFILAAYDAGVDECIHKPLSPMIFQAKVQAWLRHSRSTLIESLVPVKAGNFYIDPLNRSFVVGDGAPIHLTSLEFRLLYALMSQPDRPITFDSLIEHVWGYSGGGDNVILKNVVYRLRRKVEADRSKPQVIKTVTGVGYQFVSR